MIGTAEFHPADSKEPRFCVNDVEVSVHPSGSWIQMVHLHPGTNTFVLSQGTNELKRTVIVAETVPTPKYSSSASTDRPKPPRDVYRDLGIPTNTPVRVKPPKGTPKEKIRIMLDPGHGGSNAGAISPAGIPEKQFNLLQTLEVAQALRREGFQVLLTRSDDSFPSLYSRPKSACAEKVDMFISVHHNATPQQTDPRDVRHTVAYSSNDLGKPLAAAIQKHVALAVSPVRDNGADFMSLAVCRNPVVPSCLLEIDFINCPEGEAASLDAVRRAKVAQAVVQGVLDWLSSE